MSDDRVRPVCSRWQAGTPHASPYCCYRRRRCSARRMRNTVASPDTGSILKWIAHHGEHGCVLCEHPAFHRLVAIAPRAAHEACQQPGGESDAAPVFGHCDRELAGLVIAFACAHVLPGAHDVDAVGCWYRGNEHEILPGPRVYSALDGGAVVVLVVPHEAVV